MMALKPFTYPLPETRFLHVGRLVYKFKIRYGNFHSAPDLNNTESVAKELEEAIRVVLGNLDDLHPFSTDHFTIFPYLSKWERVSKMRFKCENVCLVPYPYICTMYLELNSFQQSLSHAGVCMKKCPVAPSLHSSISAVILEPADVYFGLLYKMDPMHQRLGKEVNKDRDEFVKRRNEMLQSTAVEEPMKRRRVEIRAETSCPSLDMDRTGDKCVHHMSVAKPGSETNSSKGNECECSPASLSMGCNRMSSWGPVESNPEQRTAAEQSEGAMQLLQQRDQAVSRGHVQSEGRGLSKFWRRY